MAPSPASDPPIISKRVFVSGGLSAALNPLSSTMVAVALPSMALAFGADPGPLSSSLVTSYLTMLIICQSPGAALAGRWGYSRTMTAGRWLFVAGSLIACVSQNMPSMVIARLIMAAAVALMVPNMMTLIRHFVAPLRRPHAFGLMSAVMAGAGALGPPLGGLLTDEWGWRAVFVGNLPFLALTWLLQASAPRKPEFYQPDTSPEPLHFDWGGSVFITATLLAFIGSTMIGINLPGLATFTGSLALMVIFLRWERSAIQPILDPALLRERSFGAGALVVGLVNLAFYGQLFTVPFLLEEQGINATTSGLVLMAMTAAMMTASLIAGPVTARLGMRITVAAGAAVTLLGVCFVAMPKIWQADASALWLALSLAFVGGGAGLASTIAQAATLSSGRPEHAGMAAAAVVITRYLGGIIGVAVLGFVMAGGHSHPERLQTSLVFYGVCCLFALSLAFLLPRRVAT